MLSRLRKLRKTGKRVSEPRAQQAVFSNFAPESRLGKLALDPIHKRKLALDRFNLVSLSRTAKIALRIKPLRPS